MSIKDVIESFKRNVKKRIRERKRLNDIERKSYLEEKEKVVAEKGKERAREEKESIF